MKRLLRGALYRSTDEHDDDTNEAHEEGGGAGLRVIFVCRTYFRLGNGKRFANGLTWPFLLANFTSNDLSNVRVSACSPVPQEHTVESQSLAGPHRRRQHQRYQRQLFYRSLAFRTRCQVKFCGLGCCHLGCRWANVREPFIFSCTT